MYPKYYKIPLTVLSLFIMVLLSSGMAAAQESETYIMNVSINGDELKFANHNDSKTEGNWITLDGGNTVQLPSPMKFTYNGVNETSFSTNGNDVDIKLNVNNYTDYSIEYPFDTHQMYVNNSQNDVDIQFNGSKSFADKNASVFLMSAKSSSIVDMFDGIKDGTITSISDMQDKVTVSPKSNSSVELDGNGDLSYSFNDVDAGNYGVLIVLNDEPVILSATAFEVLDYELDLSANPYVNPGDDFNVDIGVKNATDTEYIYTSGLTSKSAYKADIRFESTGQKSGTDLIVNNKMIVDGFDLVGMSISDIGAVDVKGRVSDVISSNNVSGKIETVNSNQTSMDINTSGLPPGEYMLFVEVSKPDVASGGIEDPIVAFEQKEITIEEEKEEGVGVPTTDPILMASILGVAMLLFLKKREE